MRWKGRRVSSNVEDRRRILGIQSDLGDHCVIHGKFIIIEEGKRIDQ